MAQSQMTLEKLTITQLLQIDARLKESGASDRIEVMTAEELELYKGNCHDYIANAQETIEKSNSDQVKEAQQSLVVKYQAELEAIDVQLNKLQTELTPENVETSTAQVELMDGSLVFLGVVELAKYLGWSKQRVSAAHHRGKLLAPEGKMYGSERPLWTPSQAREIKEKYQ
jgi:hypothetical protein